MTEGCKSGAGMLVGEGQQSTKEGALHRGGGGGQVQRARLQRDIEIDIKASDAGSKYAGELAAEAPNVHPP